MSFLDEIRKQPQETRETMFYLSVLITTLLVGTIWFHSFQKNLYVLMNPEEDAEKALAVENASVPSLFGYVGKSLTDIKGLVSGFLGDEDTAASMGKVRVDSGKVYTLPLSERK